MLQHIQSVQCVELRATCLQVIDITDGYESQEFNGVFMLSFPSTAHAVRFALILQQLLMLAEWPETALPLPQLCTQMTREGQVRQALAECQIVLCGLRNVRSYAARCYRASVRVLVEERERFSSCASGVRHAPMVYTRLLCAASVVWRHGC